MNCVVTGGLGFIGTAVVEELLFLGHDVTVFDKDTETSVTKGATLYPVDVKDEASLSMYGRHVDWVFHLAADCISVQESLEKPVATYSANMAGTISMLQFAEARGVSRFVFSSSCSVYGNTSKRPVTERASTNPISPYALSKLNGENACKMYSSMHTDMSCTSLRYFNVFGDNMKSEGAYRSVLSVFTEQYLHGEALTVFGDGEQSRDFVYVGDVAKANVRAAMSMSLKSHVYNIGTGVPTTVNDIALSFGGMTVNLPARVEPRSVTSNNAVACTELKWKPDAYLSDWLPVHMARQNRIIRNSSDGQADTSRGNYSVR